MKKVFFAAAVLLASVLSGTEYFVSPAGSDKGDGRSEKSAFRTVGKGMEVLKAGDTLTILPGKYHEAVLKVMEGDPARKTVIRAKIPGTVLIHGDLALTGFRPHDKAKGLYVTGCETEPEAVFERDTFALYERRGADLLDVPLPEAASYYYDGAKKLLYVRTSDAADPASHVLARSTFPADGFAIRPPQGKRVRNVEIDGLLVRGFMTQKVAFYFASWGIVINAAENCRIRRCTALLNCGGISMNEAFRSRIEECSALGNGTLRQVSGGNIIIWSGRESVIDRCFSFNSRTYGIRFYGSNQQDTISRCVSIEDRRGAIWIKPSDPKSKLSQIYSPALVACGHSEYSLFRVNDYDPKGANGRTSLAFGRETLHAFPASFADSSVFDFRLTRDSKFKQGFAGRDFRYLSPGGDDRNDGLSLKTPRKTLKGIPDGTTVYLLPGTYAGDLTVGGKGITLAGYGQNAPAVITGQVKVTGDGVRLRKLGFTTSGVAVASSGSGLLIENCGFARAGTAVQSSKPVTDSHCAFAPEVKTPVAAPGSVVRLSIVGKVPDAVLFGNAYPDRVPARDPAGVRLTAVFTDAPAGNFTLKNERAFRGLAVDGTLIGPVFYLFEPRKNSFFNMKILPASSRAVTLQFESDAVLKNSQVRLRVPGGKQLTFKDWTAAVTLSFVSLENLKPGTQYECRAVSDMRCSYVTGNHYLPAKIDYNHPGKNISEPVTFTTPAADRAPRTWHVSPRGDDRNPGTREKPLRNISCAALKTVPGDTVMVHGGEYRESVLVPVSGMPGKPVTYCAAPGETVWLDGNARQYCRAFGAFGKKHLRFDGFRIRLYGTALVNASGVFIFFGCRDIAVTRNFYDGRSPGYSPMILHTRNSQDILLKNCVDIGSMTGIACIDSSGVVIENNVMKMISIWPLFCMGTSKAHRVRFAYNIVTDNIRAKTLESLLKVTGPEILDEAYNIFFVRLPRELRLVIGLHTGKKWTLDQYYRLTKKDAGSSFANPGFRAFPRMLTWKNLQERAADMKKGPAFGRTVNNYEDARDPRNSIRFKVWDFRDFFANPLRKAPDGRIIGLEPDQFKEFTDATNGGRDWRVFK